MIWRKCHDTKNGDGGRFSAFCLFVCLFVCCSSLTSEYLSRADTDSDWVREYFNAPCQPHFNVNLYNIDVNNAPFLHI